MQARSPLALVALGASFLGGIAVGTAYSQAAPPPKVVLVSSMKVLPGKDEQYFNVETKVWKPLHQARIKAGNGRSWALYEVRFPSGTSASRDYVTINVFDSMLEYDKYEDSLFKALAQVYPNKNGQQLLSETVATRDLTLNELWVEVDRVDRQ
jgi:hypothetical protein